MTKDLMGILRSALTGVPYRIPADLDMDRLFDVAVAHDVEGVVAYGLRVSGKRLSPEFAQVEKIAHYRSVQQDFELRSVGDVLAKQGIAFIPLKGSVIKHYYPDGAVRTSADIDILVHPEDIKKIFKVVARELSYTHHIDKNDHHHSVSSLAGVHVELHFTLGEQYEPLASAWDRALPTETSEARLSVEDFFAYHIAHMARHFLHGGCGLRSVMDLWVMKYKMELPFNYTLISQCGLDSFTDACLRLMEVWFGDEQGNCKEHSDLTLALEKYILSGGAYGSVENAVAISRIRKSGTSHVFTRFFLPYSTMKQLYPALEKFPPLLPFCWVARGFAIIAGGRVGRVIAELSANKKITDEKINATEALLQELKL